MAAESLDCKEQLELSQRVKPGSGGLSLALGGSTQFQPTVRWVASLIF